MDQSCICLMFSLIILKLCSGLNDQAGILRSLTTNKPIYLEHETAVITASFKFPSNKSMSDYNFLWSVRYPDKNTPFIEETRYIYQHGNSGDVDRYEISFTSHSSGRGSILITIYDLKLTDQQEIKLSVFSRDPKVEIVHKLVEVLVDPSGANTSTTQVRTTVSPKPKSDTAASRLPPTRATVPLRNTKMWIPLGFIFFLILLLICLKLHSYVSQWKHIKRETKSVNSSATSTSEKDIVVAVSSFPASNVILSPTK